MIAGTRMLISIIILQHDLDCPSVRPLWPCAPSGGGGGAGTAVYLYESECVSARGGNGDSQIHQYARFFGSIWSPLCLG